MNKDNEFSLEDILAEYSSEQAPSRDESPARPSSRESAAKPAETVPRGQQVKTVQTGDSHRPEREPVKYSRRSPALESKDKKPLPEPAGNGRKPQKKKKHGRKQKKSAALGLVFVLLSLAGMAWGLMNLQSGGDQEEDPAAQEMVELRLEEIVEAQLNEMKDSVLHPQDEDPQE